MITRPLIALATAALMVGTAAGAPTLKADVTVSGAIVTVGDMFEDVGTLAETPLFRAPQPGTVGTVPLKDIEAAATRAGLAEFVNEGLSSVRVARPGVAIGKDDLVQLIETDLAARGILADGMSTQTLFSRDFAPLTAAAVAEPVNLVALRYLPGTGGFTARFTVAGLDRTVDVSGTIDLMIEMPHLAAALSAGSVLRAEHIVMRPIPLRQADAMGFASPSALVGKALKRQSREGMALKATDVAEPQVIARNEMVTIYFRSGPMTLTVKGQALNAAAQGEPVDVINLMSKRVVSTTAIASGAVEVTAAGPINLAGL
jgi:flagella basal body P-ring formation protein FlgA